MTRRIILDVSSWNPIPDFGRVARESGGAVQGVIIKATESVWSGTNPNFEGQYAAAKAAGLAVGFYHFHHTSVDPNVQADTYLAKVAGKQAELGHWLDFEGNDGGVSLAGVQAHMSTWLGRVGAVYPMKAGLYTGAYFDWSRTVDVSGHALWLAAYTSSMPWTPATLGNPVLLWQFTDAYPVYWGSCDGSVFLGTDDQWNWLTGKTPVAVPMAEKIRRVQAAVHAKQDGVFGPDTKKRCDAIRDMRLPHRHTDKAAVKYAQQVMAFPGNAANGIWDPNTGRQWFATVRAIQTAMGVAPVSGFWDMPTDFAYRVLENAK